MYISNMLFCDKMAAIFDLLTFHRASALLCAVIGTVLTVCMLQCGIISTKTGLWSKKSKDS